MNSTNKLFLFSFFKDRTGKSPCGLRLPRAAAYSKSGASSRFFAYRPYHSRTQRARQPGIIL